MSRIAKEMERKYGSAYSGKAKAGPMADCYDKGAGYDENDDFIDNTEAVILWLSLTAVVNLNLRP